MRIFYTVALIVYFFASFNAVIALDTPPVTPEIERQEVVIDYRDYAHQVAVEHGLNPVLFTDVINCESGYQPSVQSYHLYTFSDPARGIFIGERELSFGIVQIHLPAHPTISKEQALDPVFSINWMADRWVEGKQSWWSCVNMLH